MRYTIVYFKLALTKILICLYFKLALNEIHICVYFKLALNVIVICNRIDSTDSVILTSSS